MKILVGKTFGLGNAVMCIPMLKALRSLKPERLDVMIGDTPDDFGAYDIFKYLLKNGIIDSININVSRDYVYDVAIMSIPFDGRWRNQEHYRAYRVMDSRTRPDPSTTGFISWKKHEIEYQMDNARELGYKDKVPDCSFYGDVDSNNFDIYIGVGYKKDAAGFWKKKHWGNEKFAELITLLLDDNGNKDLTIWSTGNTLDWGLSLGPIQRLVSNNRFKPDITTLDNAFKKLSTCGLYIGNDTGITHVAASMDIPCIVANFIEYSAVKSHPWNSHSCSCTITKDSAEGLSVQEMFSHVKNFKGYIERYIALGETSKAKTRREKSNFFDLYCKGKGIDIGCGPDPILPDSEKWDILLGHGDATLMEGVEDETYDYVHSSHCIEHTTSPILCLKNWFRILKKDGYLSILMPHRDLYEQQKTLPSKFNHDHKVFFLPNEHELPDTLGFRQLVDEILEEGSYEIIYINTCDAGYHGVPKMPDGHAPLDSEYSIEVVIKKLK